VQFSPAFNSEAGAIPADIEALGGSYPQGERALGVSRCLAGVSISLFNRNVTND